MARTTNPISGATGAVSLISDDTWRYTAMYSLDFGMIIGRESVATPGIYATHKLTDAAGAGEVTAMGLPLIKDTHAYPGIAILGDGRLAIWGNMHGGTVTNDQLRMMISNNPGDISSWTAATLPSVGPKCSYPTPVQLPDGRVFFMIRDTGISAVGDWGCWFCPAGSSTFGPRTTLMRGISVPNANGPGNIGSNGATDDVDDWSAYPTTPVVKDLGGGAYKMAFMGTWRVFGADVAMLTWARAQGLLGPTDPLPAGMGAMACVQPFYVEYRFPEDKWYTIDGTQVVPPFDPVNTGGGFTTGLVANDDRGAPSPVNAQGLFTGLGYNYTNEGGMCLDARGLPHYVNGHSPNYHIYNVDGTRSGWRQIRLATSAQAVAIGSLIAFTPILPVLFRREIWYLCTGGTFTTPLRMLLAKPDGSTIVPLGNILPVTSEVNAMLQPPPATLNFAITLTFGHDPEALRRRGTIELCVPIGDVPHSEIWGNTSQRLAV